MLISKCMTPVLILTLGIWSFIRRKKQLLMSTRPLLRLTVKVTVGEKQQSVNVSGSASMSSGSFSANAMVHA